MEKNTPLIVAFVADLMFTSKIANVARHLNYRVTWIETAVSATVSQPQNPPPRQGPGERLTGPDSQLFADLTTWQPALLLFDLTNNDIPWARWIPALKSSPATRRFPIMCFGPHQDVELIKIARQVGADFVFARSRFTASMPDLLQKHALIADYDLLREACVDPLPDLVKKGIALFNEGHYFQCHDDLEAAWNQDKTAGRDLYRGILQVGIALYQVERGNYRGAIKMLMRVRQWLDPLPDICRSVNIGRLRTNAYLIQETITKLGPERLTEFDWQMVEPVEIVVSPL